MILTAVGMAPAYAQTDGEWMETLTVGSGTDSNGHFWKGYHANLSGVGSLTGNTFAYGGTTYRIDTIATTKEGMHPVSTAFANRRD